MYHQGRRSTAEVQALRREAGRWLKARREGLGLSQSQLARRLGDDHYTFVSQLEIGRTRIPPDRYRNFAEAMEMAPPEFARRVMRFYDPELSELLFPEDGAEEGGRAEDGGEGAASPRVARG